MIKPSRSVVAGMGIGAALLVAVMQYEGFEPEARSPVPGDVATKGYGHTGADVRRGDKADPVREAVWLLGALDKKYAAAVRQCVKVPLYQHEFDAYTSLTYNIGPAAFCHSTLVKKLNSGDYRGACESILGWDKFKGKPLKGLTTRRQGEYKQCIG